MLVDNEIPQLLRRRHILSGYRPLNQSIPYYITSAFKLHNEFVNFWTHMLPLFFIYFYYIHPEIFFEVETRWPLLILYIGTTKLLLASSFTHLMHSRSQLDHIFWLLIDFSGILTFSLCIGLQRLAMRPDSSSFFNNFYIYTLIFVVYLQYISTSALFVLRPFWKTRHIIRLFTCLLCGIWLYIPLIHRYFSSPTPSSLPDIGLDSHSSAFQWLLISGIFMGVNFPECICPGFFDYFCYGHQIFHICIFMVTWNLCEGATKDAIQYSNFSQYELKGPIIKVLVGNALGISTTIWVLIKYAKVKTADKAEKVSANDCGGVPDDMGVAT